MSALDRIVIVEGDISRTLVERAELTAMAWRDFLLSGPPGTHTGSAA